MEGGAWIRALHSLHLHTLECHIFSDTTGTLLRVADTSHHSAQWMSTELESAIGPQTGVRVHLHHVSKILCHLIAREWEVVSLIPSWLGSDVLCLWVGKRRSLPSEKEGGFILSLLDQSKSLTACTTRAISGHAPIGGHHLQIPHKEGPTSGKPQSLNFAKYGRKRCKVAWFL